MSFKKAATILIIFWLYLYLVFNNTYVFTFKDNGVILRGNIKTGQVHMFKVDESDRWIEFPLKKKLLP